MLVDEGSDVGLGHEAGVEAADGDHVGEAALEGVGGVGASCGAGVVGSSGSSLSSGRSL